MSDAGLIFEGLMSPTTRRVFLVFSSARLSIPIAAAGWIGPNHSANAAGGVNPPATKFVAFTDTTHQFSIQVPDGWTLTEQNLKDRRKILLWTDPMDKGTSLFVVYTPVRDDFTSLGSFGSVDQVASQVILPKGRVMDEASGVESKMISAFNMKQAYFFDYVQSVAGVQPPTHYRVIFSLRQGATGGAGGVLVTVTAQTPEASYNQNKALFDQIIDSYSGISSA
jgi:hypothetical protein